MIMNILKAALLVLGLAGSAAAQATTNYYQIKYTTTTGKATESLSGYLKVAASSQTASTFTIVLDGTKGGVNASSFTARYGVVAATGVYSGNVTAGSFTGPITAGSVDFSTITTALALKVDLGNPAQINLSTVTTALGLKANLAGATFTAASGITNAAFTATGANGNIISGSSITASAFFGSGANLSNVPSGTIVFASAAFTTAQTFTNTTLAGCNVVGSSLPWVSAGRMAYFWYSGESSKSGGAGNKKTQVWLDGATVELGASGMLTDEKGGTVGGPHTFMGTIKTSAGAHTICMGVSTNADTFTFCGNGSGNSVCQFVLSEP